jgi:hypothetical protein
MKILIDDFQNSPQNALGLCLFEKFDKSWLLERKYVVELTFEPLI